MSEVFEARVALVTGGSSGIGAATARLLAEQGAQVTITGRNEEALRAVAAQHPRIDWVKADVSEPAAIARSIDHVRARFDRLDVLVNNAGILELAPLAAIRPEHVRRTFAVNVEGLIETTRLALPLLQKTKGNVVNVTTVIADQPFANMSVYCASKAAVLALTRAWAQELGAEGVRVNAVSPGPVATAMFSAGKLGISEAELSALGSGVLGLVPLGRFGQPEEIARVIAFVASPAASYMTGAELSVGGGLEA